MRIERDKLTADAIDLEVVRLMLQTCYIACLLAENTGLMEAKPATSAGKNLEEMHKGFCRIMDRLGIHTYTDITNISATIAGTNEMTNLMKAYSIAKNVFTTEVEDGRVVNRDGGTGEKVINFENPKASPTMRGGRFA